MRLLLPVTIIAFLGTMISGTTFAEDKKLETLEERYSYGVGLWMGADFKTNRLSVDTNLILQGMRDAMGDKEPLMTMEEARAAIMELQQVSRNKVAEQNKKKGAAFLAENAKKEGIQTTASGLQYKELKVGTGATPTASDKVKVHYVGSLLSGREFDSSSQRGEPVTFEVGQVIKGWAEGLQLMKEGGKYQLFIPSDLAYGDLGAGKGIGPGETLVFEVELIEVIK